MADAPGQPTAMPATGREIGGVIGANAGAARDVRIIGLVAGAHAFSHFFQLVLPPLFPVLRDAFGVSYVALGVWMSVFYGASAVGQTVSGFLVDRFGARRILAGGLGVVGASIALAGLSPSYALLLPIAVAAGLGNSVFHPADYSIFNAAVDPRRLGRAYSAHGISGSLGWAVAPAVVVGASGLVGWRAALVAVGGVGVAAALFVGSQRSLLADHRPAPAAPGAAGRPRLANDLRLFLTAPILMAFAYFALLAASLSAMQAFSVSALVAIYGAPLGLATGGLTAYLLAGAAGILAGGLLADRAARPDLVAGGGMLLAAVFTVILASGVPAPAWLPVLMAAIGFWKGVTAPSRDLVVRGATPVGASGKVFGFVYSGLDLGAFLLPPVYGRLLDRGEPRVIFLLAAGLMVLTTLTVLQVRRHARPART